MSEHEPAPRRNNVLYPTGSWRIAPCGTVDSARCEVCGSPMLVERDRLGPTCWGDAVAGIKRPHDFFICPHHDKPWHERLESVHPAVFEMEFEPRPSWWLVMWTRQLAAIERRIRG